jgi:hypothetical protein
METVRTETLQAQGWEKWLPGSNPLGGSNYLKSDFIALIVGSAIEPDLPFLQLLAKFMPALCI